MVRAWSLIILFINLGLLRGIHAETRKNTRELNFSQDESVNPVKPYKNATWIFSCLFDDHWIKNDTKSDGNPIIFFANAMEIP